MAQLDPKKVRRSVQGASTIAELFAVMFRLAAAGLSGSDVAALLRHPVGNVDVLGWATPEMRAEIARHIDALALRDPRDRLRLRDAERKRLIEVLGGDRALGDPRLCFLIAQALDERYEHVSPRVDPGARGRVVELPPVFLAEATNPAPRIGQMTPQAACRRWMRAFWYAGEVLKLDVFGPLPTPRERELPGRTRQTLQGAVDEGVLRISVVSWKAHALADLAEHSAAEGCFAIRGFHTEPTVSEIDVLLAAVRRAKPHIAVFPEVAFSETAFQLMQTALVAERARFPALLVLGLGHRPHVGGGFDNTAVVIDASGDIVLEHEKMEPFARPSDGALEDIIPRCSQVYEYVDTPAGRLVANVCRDVRSDVPMLMNRALGVSLLMVPAYSGRLEFVLEEARVLGSRQMAIVAAANAPGPDVRDAAAFYAPIRGSASSRCNPVQAGALGTVHAFSVGLAKGAAATLDAAAVVTV